MLRTRSSQGNQQKVQEVTISFQFSVGIKQPINIVLIYKELGMLFSLFLVLTTSSV